MGDPPSSQFMPPPPIPSITRPNFHMMYYGLVVVGTTLVVLALYNLIIVRWSGGYTANQRGPHRAFSSDVGPTRSRSLSNLNVMNYFVYSFMYKKDEKGNDSECAICLSVFEEGEELRQLPNCMHSFHANCIGMWLYSHMDCPLCRTSAEPPSLGRRVVSEQPEEHSREGLIDALASV